MKRSKSGAVFLVTNPSNYLDSGSKQRHISTVRSHIASHRHSLNRERKDTHQKDPVPENPEDFAGISSPRDSRFPHGEAQDLDQPFAATCEETHASPEPVDDGISMKDIVDVFYPTVQTYEKGKDKSDNASSLSSDTTAASVAYPHIWAESDGLTQPRYSKSFLGNVSRPSQSQISYFDRSAEAGSHVAAIEDTVEEIARLDETGAGSRTPSIAQISATLDPFIRLPIEITMEEKSLMHFYFNFGRRWLWGTSQTPMHCPAFDIARALLQVCPIFVMTNVLVAESILSRVTHRDLRPQFYSRRAQIYKAVNDLLSDDRASLYHKIIAIMDLALIEYANGRLDIQTLHIKAVDQFIESRGGVAMFRLQAEDIVFGRVSARFYTSQFVRSEVQIPTFRHLKVVKKRFIDSLHRIENWISTHRFPVASTDIVAVNHNELDLLTDYLYHLQQQSLVDGEIPTPFYKISGAHFCALSLAMTMVEYNLTSAAAFAYLYRAQEYMRRSTEVSHHGGEGLEKLHPFAAGHIFSHTRSVVFDDFDDAKELAICQVVVDAQKIFVLLSETRRVELSKFLFENVIVLAKTADGGTTPTSIFDRKTLRLLEQEIHISWTMKHISQNKD